MENASRVESVWKRLRNGDIATCEEALKLLVDPLGNLHIDWLDQDLNYRFFREFEDRSILPPLIPLLMTEQYGERIKGRVGLETPSQRRYCHL